MKIAKLTFSATIEIVMRVPDDAPLGDIEGASSSDMLEELKKQFAGDPSTRLIGAEVITAAVVEV